MSKQSPAQQTWLTRLMPNFVLKAFGQIEENPETPEHGASWMVGNGVAPTFSPRQSMAVYARHAYTNACVSRASQDIASLPIKLLRGNGASTQEINEHPVLDLFHQPSSTVDGYLFREQFIVDLMLTGNCYTLIVGSESAPTSLYRLHPENVRIIPDPIKIISAFEYTDGGSQTLYAPERVVHIRNASWDIEARGELYGSGIVEALNEEITADINAQRMSASVSKQGRPDVLLSPVDPADIWDRRRRQEITQAYKAMTEHGGAMALSGQIKVETLNLSPRDIEFQALRTLVRENISAVCGVPSTVLGLPDANYATARQATITYWEIQQKRARKLEQFMTRIAKLFDSALRVEIDFSGVDALQSIRTEKLDRVVMHIDNGMSPSAAYAYENLDDSPFGTNTTEAEAEETEQDKAIQDALIEMFQRAKEEDLAKIGNMKQSFEELPNSTQKALTTKAIEHNEKVEQDKAKTTTKFRLAVVYWRGVGAYKTNPSSVRPSVNSAEQWAMGRVNSYLYALRNGRFRSGKHDTDLLPKDHPMAGKDEKKKNDETLSELKQRQEKMLLSLVKGSVGDVDPTNFPKDDEDKQVALRNSEFERFPHAEALALKEDFPQIWREGGNILGNKQFNRLLPIAQRDSSVATTPTEEKAIRLREAWAARHFKDHRLAGVVAQIKWLVVGSRGISHMRKVISEEKARLSKKTFVSVEADDAYWQNWMTKAVNPAERQMQRATEIYLEQAAERYIKYAENLRKEREKQNKSISYASIFGRLFEISEVQKIIGKAYRTIFTLTGNDQMDELYKLTNRSRGLDLIFDERTLPDRQLKRLAQQVTSTTEKTVRKIVRDGIQEGVSNKEIAKRIRRNTTFSEKRATRIAQTETSRAINTATSEAYEQFAKNEDIKVYKRWISSRDDRTRETHLALDKQTRKEPIPVGQKFEIGSKSAAAPAGFNEAALDINCRCTIAPVIIED